MGGVIYYQSTTNTTNLSGQDLGTNLNNFTTLSTIDPNFIPTENIPTTNFSEDYSPYRYNTTQMSKFNASYAPNSTIQAATEPTESISESCSDALKRLCKDFMASDFDDSNPRESTRKLVDLILNKINDCNDCKEIYDIRVIILNFPNNFMDALEDQLNKEDSSESSCDFWKAVVDISKENEPKIREKLRQKNG